jgi:hypothetical protein
MFDSMNGLVAGLQGHNSVLLVRWYGTRAQVTGRSPDPLQCARTTKVLTMVGEVSKAATDQLASEFRAGYEHSACISRQMLFERDCGRADRCAAQRIAEPAEPAIVRTFRWFGQLAYIRGIDGSPWHDSHAVKRLKREPNAMSVRLIRAWEAGYDDAYDNERQLLLERRSILEQPRVYNARHIRVAVPRASDKKD